jgi:hypothetical protein
MRYFRVIALLFFATSLLRAQSQQPAESNGQVAHHIPFASSTNRIELAIFNGMQVPVSDVRVECRSKPEWVTLSPDRVEITELGSGTEETATFTLSVDRKAPIAMQVELNFTVTTTTESYSKTILIEVNRPERFELFQNYPNPFNPTTTIGYTLATESKVVLRLFDVLGSEVKLLLEETQPAGFREATMDASTLPSGVYFYRLEATGVSDPSMRYAQVRKMLLMK